MRGYYVTSGIPANAIVQIRTSLGQYVNHNSLGTMNREYFSGRSADPSDPTLRITGRAEMPSLEIYHEDLSRQELQVWNRPVAEAQHFSEDYMDDSMIDRALSKGLPPTNISYAEFVGTRVKTLSYMSFKNEQDLEGLLVSFWIKEMARDLTQMMNQSLSKEKAKAKERMVRVKTRARAKENSFQLLSIQII